MERNEDIATSEDAEKVQDGPPRITEPSDSAVEAAEAAYPDEPDEPAEPAEPGERNEAGEPGKPAERPKAGEAAAVSEPPGPRPPPASIRERARGFLRDLWARLETSDIFFMAGAISFNLIVAVIPLFLLAVGIAGFVLAARYPNSTEVITNLLLESLPAVEGEVALIESVEGVVQQILAERASFGLVGALFFVWISTRLIGTLRTVLRYVFDVKQERSIVRGKIFDAQIVVIAGLLITINLGITVAVEAFQRFGMDLIGLQDRGMAAAAESAVSDILAFLSIWVLFLLIYRYLPRRFPPWRTVIIAATVTAVFFEAMKFVFAWYATDVADYRTAYGNLTTVAILFFWIYYGAVVFIFGGHVAQVSTLRRDERLKWKAWRKEQAHHGASAAES